MNNSGKNHPQYKDGKGTEPYSSKFTIKLREEIRQRDHNKCVICGMTKKEHFKKYGRNLEVHHKNRNRKDCKKNNLFTTCKPCNIKERDTKNE
jgi:5-methylcytosine-specific restriction endonuclease McrA